jgi:hypothetical protein
MKKKLMITNQDLKPDIIVVIRSLSHLTPVNSIPKDFNFIQAKDRHKKRKVELQYRLKGKQKPSKRLNRLSNKRHRKLDHTYQCTSGFIIQNQGNHSIITLVLEKINFGKVNQTLGNKTALP